MRTTKAVLVVLALVGLGVVGCGQPTEDEKRQAEQEERPEVDQQEAEAVEQQPEVDKQKAEDELEKSKVFVMKRDHDAAMACYDEAIQLNPDDTEAYFSRGSVYYDKGELDKAIASN